MILDRDGSAWFTDGGQNAIVRVDAKTLEVKKWPLPADSGYTNLNTAIFDKAGIHWFTGQSGIYGRLDPRTGELKVFDAPKGRGPYGIHATPDGTVYFASLAGSYVGRIDAATNKVQVIEPPTKNQGARRVWSDSKGMVWVAEWDSGNLSRYDPKSGAWKTWKAPGERPRVYAVYVDETDRPWISEWDKQLMMRFDPGDREMGFLRLRPAARPTCARSTAARAKSGRPSRPPESSSSTATSSLGLREAVGVHRERAHFDAVVQALGLVVFRARRRARRTAAGNARRWDARARRPAMSLR